VKENFENMVTRRVLTAVIAVSVLFPAPSSAGMEELDQPQGRIAFCRGGFGSTQQDIFTIGADGRGLKRLTNEPGYDCWPNWSPDGRRIVFQ
jgi:hypothetical protein